jgi:fatty-acyl-CoA synthase
MRVLEPDPARIAIQLYAGGWQPLSCAALKRAVFGAAHVLHELGVRKGDRVVIALDTGIEAIAGLFGSIAIGAIPALVQPYAVGSDELEVYVPRLAEKIARARAAYLIAPRSLEAQLGGLGASFIADDRVLREADASPVTVEASHGDLCLLQLTSGSTGIPRAVELTHGNVLANLHATHLIIDPVPGDSVMMWLPLYHDMGLQGGFFTPLFGGFDLYMMSPIEFLRSPTILPREVSAKRATVLVAPHFSFGLLARVLTREACKSFRLDSVRIAFNGAEPIEVGSLESFLDAAAPLGYKRTAMNPCYGMAEATLIATCTPSGRGARYDVVDSAALARGHALAAPQGPRTTSVVSCGVPAAGVEVSIIGEDGTALGERHVGDVVLSGPAISRGYFGDESSTKKTYDGGRFHTGDVGYMAEGELFIVGRKKDILYVSGHRFAPQHVEWAAEKVSGVRAGRTAAFGLSDPHRGIEKVILACESAYPLARHEDLKREVARVVHDEVGIQVEVRIVPKGAIPKTTSGKVQRHLVRQSFLEPTAA